MITVIYTDFKVCSYCMLLYKFQKRLSGHYVFKNIPHLRVQSQETVVKGFSLIRVVQIHFVKCFVIN